MASSSRAAKVQASPANGRLSGEAQTSNEGQTATLPCRISNTLVELSKGGYVLEWHREQKGLIYSAHKDDAVGKTALDFQGRLQHNGWSLIISSLRVTDAGIYWCVVKPLKGMAGSIPTGKRVQLSVHAAPSFTRVSEPNVYKRLGENARFECLAKGVPPPEITWKKDGSPLRSRGGLQLAESSLVINEIQDTDDGLYECEAGNIAGSRSHTTRLHVAGGIRFTQLPHNRTVAEGSDTTFNCIADSSPNRVSYKWFFEDRDLHAAGTLALRSRVEEGSLKIQRIMKEDSGWYSCQASDDVGSSSTFKAYLDVQYKPRILSNTPVIQFVPLGLPGQIRCNVDANPPHQAVQWQKDGAKMNLGENSGNENRYRMEDNGSILKISQVTQADSGEYTCQPSNDLGSGLPFEIRVLSTAAPIFELTPAPMTEKTVGQSWSTTCSAYIQGNTEEPQPEVFWRRKDGTRVPYGKNGRLIIESVSELDHGCYDCVVRTKATELTKEACLRVVGIVPRAPEQVTVITGAYDARVSWTPGYDGGFDKDGGQHFVAKYRPRISSRIVSAQWHTLNATTSSEVIITHLMPSTDYEFVIEPRNPLGVGVPSPTSLVRTKGDNFGDLFVVPTDRPGGVTYFPDFGAQSFGPRPPAPRDLSFVSDYPTIIFSWHQPPSPVMSDRPPVPVFYYSIEYRQIIEPEHLERPRNDQAQRQKSTIGTNNFKLLADRISEDNFRVPVNRPPFMPGKTFDVRVKAHSVASYSEPSNLVSFTVPGIPPQTALIAGIAGGVAFLFLSLVLSMLAIRCAKRRRARRTTQDSRTVKNYHHVQGAKSATLVYANGKQRADSLTDDTGGFAEWAKHGGSTIQRQLKPLTLNNNRTPVNGYRKILYEDDGVGHSAAAELPDLSCPTNPLLTMDPASSTPNSRVPSVSIATKSTITNDKSPQLPELTEADLMMFPHSRESQV